MIDLEIVKEFRKHLRGFERELEIQNNCSGSCCGVSIAQCHTLMELDNEDNITLNELADRLNLDKSTISRTTEGLVNLGLVIREIPKNNRRSVLIKLTTQGKAVCKKINDDNNNYFQHVLESLNNDRLLDFIDSFKTIVNKMKDRNSK